MTVGGVHPDGPLFLSYRQSDGTATAAALAWLLRATGLSVWHDQTDLPPGDTERRLDEALADGLCGAVLLVTPDIACSAVVRSVELPQLLGLASDAAFALAVANTIERDNGHLDYAAPDALLGQPLGTLASLKQYPVRDRSAQTQLVGELLGHRTGRLAVELAVSGGRPLHLDIQTRATPHASQPAGADLTIRLRSGNSGRLPDPEGLLDLQATLPLLPAAVSRTGVSQIRITGGAHLSVGFALGAALPATLIGDVQVEGTGSDLWTASTVSGSDATPTVRIKSHVRGPLKATGVRRDVLAYVDLLPDQSNAAYTRLLSEFAGLDAWEHLRPMTSGRLDAARAATLVEEIAGHLRRLVQDNDHARLHLLLRCPFPVAVLLGRLSNTLRAVVYEWDDTERSDDPDARPRYVATLEVRSSQPAGPITEVLLTP